MDAQELWATKFARRFAEEQAAEEARQKAEQEAAALREQQAKAGEAKLRASKGQNPALARLPSQKCPESRASA